MMIKRQAGPTNNPRGGGLNRPAAALTMNERMAFID